MRLRSRRWPLPTHHLTQLESIRRLLPIPVITVVGFGQTETKANIDISGSTKIKAFGDITVHTTIEGHNEVVTRGMGNSRISISDNVEVAVSLSLALNNFQSTIVTGAGTEIESTTGSISLHAKGDNDVATQADSIIFQDGVAGLAIAVSVDNGTVTNTVNGKLTASNAVGIPAYAFAANQVVNLTEDSITLANIPADKPLRRGDRLIYDANGQTAIGGLVSGDEYVIADVENVPAGNVFTGTQKIRLAEALTLDIGNEAVLPNSQQTLGSLRSPRFHPSRQFRFEHQQLDD